MTTKPKTSRHRSGQDFVQASTAADFCQFSEILKTIRVGGRLRANRLIQFFKDSSANGCEIVCWMRVDRLGKIKATTNRGFDFVLMVNAETL